MSHELLEALCAEGACWPFQRVTVVAAHPDDEVIGLGSRLAHLAKHVSIVHVTDGSPRNLYDARNSGFSTREEYAQARQREMEAALALAGIEPSQVHQLGYLDQESSLYLAPLVRRLCEELGRLEPEVLFTHSYEGGHPDHDSTAFGVHCACRLLDAQGACRPFLFEMTSYHNRGGQITPCEFLPHEECEVVTHVLTDTERQTKQRMLDCYVTQRETLGYFPVELERFRAAPHYDFCSPPHEGMLFYEMFEWGMTGERWRQLAGQALEELGVNVAR